MRRAAPGRLVSLALLVVLLGGCTYYPTIRDTGGPRMEPKNGRIVRVEGGAICYFDLESTGGFEDTLLAAESRVARSVLIVSATGAPSGAIPVPAESRLVFSPGGYRITLGELTQPLTAGDGIIVTLIFAKSGRIGLVSVVE
jgi:copper(I)-binding protein